MNLSSGSVGWSERVQSEGIFAVSGNVDALGKSQTETQFGEQEAPPGSPSTKKHTFSLRTGILGLSGSPIPGHRRFSLFQ